MLSSAFPSPYDAAHHAKKAYHQEFEVYGHFIQGFAEHGGMGVSLMFEKGAGFGMGNTHRGFSLANYERLDTFETRMAIAREAYRTLRSMAKQPDLGPGIDVIPAASVTAWVDRICNDLCR